MFAFLNNCHEAQISVYTPQEQQEWRATERVIRQIEDGLRKANPGWRERMAEWEDGLRADTTDWIVVRPEDDATGDQKHYVLEDSSVLAAGYAPTFFTTEFLAETRLPRITAVRLELLNDPNLPHGGPGRSIYGTCALTEFRVEAAPLDHPGQRKPLKFVKSTADVNPPERELDQAFDDRSGRRRVTGPIEYANDLGRGHRAGPQQRAAQCGIRARKAARSGRRRAADVQARPKSWRMEQRRKPE
jgi:hypothetical protein